MLYLGNKVKLLELENDSWLNFFYTTTLKKLVKASELETAKFKNKAEKKNLLYIL